MNDIIRRITFTVAILTIAMCVSFIFVTLTKFVEIIIGKIVLEILLILLLIFLIQLLYSGYYRGKI